MKGSQCGSQPTHTKQEALVLLDGAQASQEARHHDDGAQRDNEVGGRQRWEGWRQRGKVALRHRQPHAHAQQAAPAQLQQRHRSPIIIIYFFGQVRFPERRAVTQKSRLKRKSMYLTQQTQPRAILQINGPEGGYFYKKIDLLSVFCTASFFYNVIRNLPLEYEHRGETGRSWKTSILTPSETSHSGLL